MIAMLRRRLGLGVIPRTVFVLGFVSMLMDISSEMIHGLMPLYLTGVLGVSAALLGLIEGIAEATVAVAKAMSGALSDRIGRRRPLVVAGYSVAALTKPVFALAPFVWPIMAARFIDRFAKGVRGAPRDALITDLTPGAHRGTAFGLRQSLDTIGAVVGPLLAIALMLASDANFILVFAIAIVPAAASAMLAFAGVADAPETSDTAAPVKPPRATGTLAQRLRRLGGPFAAVVTVGVLITMARMSEAFLILRSQDAEVPLWLAPIVLVAMNVVYALSSLPSGRLGDRVGRLGVMAVGCAILLLAELVLAVSASPLALGAGIVLWGLHMGLTQGLLSAFVAATAPADLRGTAFGAFHLACGVAVLVASTGAGLLWDAHGGGATFLAGAAASILALAALPLLRRIAP